MDMHGSYIALCGFILFLVILLLFQLLAIFLSAVLSEGLKVLSLKLCAGNVSTHQKDVLAAGGIVHHSGVHNCNFDSRKLD